MGHCLKAPSKRKVGSMLHANTKYFRVALERCTPREPQCISPCEVLHCCAVFVIVFKGFVWYARRAHAPHEQSEVMPSQFLRGFSLYLCHRSCLSWNEISILNVYGNLQMGLSFNNNILRCPHQKRHYRPSVLFSIFLYDFI